MVRAMEKRKRQRAKRRLTCELAVEASRYPAIVRDISPSGMFLQTRVKPEPGSVVVVVFPEQDGRPEIQVEAGVARHRVVPPRLQASVPGGVGLEVLDPPPEFKDLVAAALGEAQEQEPQPAPPVRDQAIRTFRVRVKQRDKPASRVLTIRCENAAGARARALAQAGRGWMIADIQEV